MPKHLEPSKPCACQSGKAHGECCRPYLRGEREAPDAVALMRSRYTAFALHHAPYLLRTLHPSVEERRRPEGEMLTMLLRACRAYDYRGLVILDQQQEAGRAQVLFLAELADRGGDCSFVERSDFLLEEGRWFYTAGAMKAARELSAPRSLTLATFVPDAPESRAP